MPTSAVRATLLVALACAAAAPARAAAQTTRERLRVEKDRADSVQAERDRRAREREQDRRLAEDRRREEDRVARERERDRERDREWDRLREQDRVRAREREMALARAQEARERALSLARERAARVREEQLRASRERAYVQERARREAEERRSMELRRTLERERAARQRDVRRRFRDELRPRLSLSGGLDMREFDGNDDRYLVQAGIDFRTRSGLGMRPEVTYAWTGRGSSQPILSGPSGTPVGTITTGRNQALGVMLNATYTFLRGSMVRPYLLGGPGVVSTRIAPISASTVILLPGTTTPVLPSAPARHELDVGLNAGAGIEVGVGPVRLFTEARYFLTDTPPARGFSGMVPLTAGIRF